MMGNLNSVSQLLNPDNPQQRIIRNIQSQEGINNGYGNNSSLMQKIGVEQSPLFSQRSTNLSMNNSSLMGIDQDKLQNMISLQNLGQVKQLYSELTLYPDDEEKQQLLVKDEQKFKKSLRNSMEGLLKVLIWRLDGAITPAEFTQIYLEWMKKRDITNAILNTSSKIAFSNLFNEQQYLFELLQNYLKDATIIESHLPKMLDILTTEFNQIIKTQNYFNQITLGLDSVEQPIPLINQEWIDEVEKLYAILDDECRGSIDSDRIQYFLMALLLNEIKSFNRDDMILLVQKQTAAIMEHMYESNGVINLRNFKQYLLIQRLRREAEIQTLKSNLQKINRYWLKAKRLSQFKQFPIIQLMMSKFPQTKAQSIASSLNDKQFDLFIVETNCKQLNEMNNNSMPSDKNINQKFKILKFYINELFQIGSINEYLDGTIILDQTLDEYADKIFKTFINNCQADMNLVIQNISTFKQIFVKALKEYKNLNNLVIAAIIDQHLQGNLPDNPKKADQTQVETYQTQNSPPKKPNLSPIPSSSRLANENSIKNFDNLQSNQQNLSQNIQKRQSNQFINQQTPELTFSPRDIQNSVIIPSSKGSNADSNTSKNYFNQQQQSTTSRMSNINQEQIRQKRISHNNNNKSVVLDQQKAPLQSDLPTFSIDLSKLSNATQNTNPNIITTSRVSNIMPVQSSNTSRTSSQIPYASAKNANNFQNSFSSQFSQENIQTTSMGTAAQKVTRNININPYNDVIKINLSQYKRNGTNESFTQGQIDLKEQNITPVKQSLRQQIEQQSLILSSIQKQSQNTLQKTNGLFNYSSQKNTSYKDQHQPVKFSKVISPTPLSNVPHQSKGQNKRDNSNSSQQNTNNGKRLSNISGDMTSRQSSNNQRQIIDNPSSTAQQRRNGQQPLQNNLPPRARTPLTQNNNAQQRQKSPMNIITDKQQILKKTSNNNISGPGSSSSINRQNGEKSPINSIRSSSNYDKSPIRSRRVENYEDVIGRLISLSNNKKV
ncbi:UNKNOWN [Stylonychia lemnae]|uniref:Uncharacterized protein n=1 Tax=Stylonychia lemnae TaxID=5949 RepID=A0A078B5A5_STYLE|nr:UNKNOWN [Stylonychia lemnae]|eukprot:CDW89710.1 UNKNOWN [Stylonychia lemnae]